MPPSSQLAQISLGLNTSALASGLRSAFGMLQSFASGVGARMSSLAFSPKQGKGQNWATHAGGQVAGTLAMRGIDMLVDQGKAVFDFERKLVRFGIAARQTPMQLNAIRTAARATAAATGVDASVVLDSARAYVDLAGAQNSSVQKMDLLARAGQASEAAGADLAGMMYTLTRVMKVADDQMEDTMGGLINQAKDGAIEAKQMAAEFAGVLPLFARFGVVGREGAIQAGAMFQVMRDGANSASEAGTMMQRVYAGIQSYAPRFEKEGVQVYKKERDKLGRKVLLPFSVIFKNIQGSEAMKDPARIKKMFGRTEGWRGMLLGDEASRALDKIDKQGKAGVSRLEELEAAGRVNGVIMRDLGTITESAGGRMDIAFEKMKNAVAAAFTPERIEKFIGAIEALATKVEPLVAMVGKMGDILGGLFSGGKSVRKFLSFGDSKLAPTTPADVARYRENHPGTSEVGAYQALQTDWGRMRKLKQDVDRLMPDDKTTKESDRRVVESAMGAASGSEELNAAMSYLNESGMTRKHQDEIWNQIRKETIDEDIAKGRGSSKSDGVPTIDQFKVLIDQHLAPAISRAVVDANNIKPSVLHLDGNKVSQSTSNATDQRRK